MKPAGILQFGTTGQLGRELLRCAERQGVDLIALPRDLADFTKADEIRRAVLETRGIEAVVNAVAYTAVDKAEADEDTAQKINATAVRELARACAERDVPLVHVSTDYVYDGEKPTPYVETDRTHPLGVYGRTKLEGENAIRESGVRHVILRTSWVYSSFGANFVKTMLRLGAERDELRIVSDQTGAPTSAADLAKAVLQVAVQLPRRQGAEACGIFHFAGAGATSWDQFAQTIFDMARGTFAVKARVTPITTSEYPTAALRPRNSRLDCAKIKDIYHIEPEPWQSALATVLEELRQGSAP